MKLKIYTSCENIKKKFHCLRLCQIMPNKIKFSTEKGMTMVFSSVSNCKTVHLQVKNPSCKTYSLMMSTI
jgi:hypothetical protein